jgi:hypothetical protein
MMRMAPFLSAERFASQFGTQEARDQTLDGLKKPNFARSGLLRSLGLGERLDLHQEIGAG